MNAGLQVVDWAAACSGLLRLGLRRARRGLTILIYHRILPAAEAHKHPLRNMVVTRECFEQQVAWLARRMNVVTVRDGLDALNRGSTGRKPLVALTFDDGYLDNAQHAAPILEANGVRGTFFVTTGFLRGEPMWFDRAMLWYGANRGAATGGAPGAPAHEKAPQLSTTNPAFQEARSHLRSIDSWLGWLKAMTRGDRDRVLHALGATRVPDCCAAMTVDQVVEMSKRGHEIAAHTVHHPILSNEPPESVRAELLDAKREIETWTGKPVTGFCYPNGLCSESVREACIDAGYTYATTTRRGVNWAGDDPMMLSRRWIAPDSTTDAGQHSRDAFAAEVLGLHDFIRDRMGRPRGPAGSPPKKPVGAATRGPRRAMSKAA